jgi:hypothetical protein
VLRAGAGRRRERKAEGDEGCCAHRGVFLRRARGAPLVING